MVSENSNTTEQIRIAGALAALQALNKMDSILNVEAPSQEQYWRNWDEAIAGIKTAAGDMSPTAEGVLMALAEYISVELTAGAPRTDGGWKPEAAMMHGEVLAYRKSFDQSYQEANHE